MSLYRRKRAMPFGKATPFDPRTGQFVAFGDPPFRDFTVVEVGHDLLLCADRDGRSSLVLKPWALRKSAFNGETFEGVVYASTDIDVRTATPGGGSAIEERVTPPYFVGEKIVAYRRATDTDQVSAAAGELTGVPAAAYRIYYEDANTAGRQWVSADTVIAKIATDDGGGAYTWTKLRGDGPDEGSAVEADDTEGVAADTVVVLHLDHETGEWVFTVPPPGDYIGASFSAPTSTDHPIAANLFTTTQEASGITVVNPGEATITKAGVYELTCLIDVSFTVVGHLASFRFTKGGTGFGPTFRKFNERATIGITTTFGGTIRKVALAVGDVISSVTSTSNAGDVINPGAADGISQWSLKFLWAG